jgi:hypothetical protein
MITSIRLEHSDVIQLRNDYLCTLVAPTDGMWESVAIAHANFWEIQYQEQRVGHFCIDSNNYLLRFYLLETYQARSQEIRACSPGRLLPVISERSIWRVD